MEDGFHIAVLACHLDAFIHILLHLWVGFKVAVYQLFGFLARNAHAFGKPEDGDAVDDAEVCRFCLAAHVGGYVVYIYLIYLGSGGGVDVVSAEEGFYHVLIFAEVCHDAQLYLRVVGREELAAGVGDERLADFLSVFVADGDVLQVGIAGAEASGSGHRLVEGGVYAARTWVDELGQGIYIGAQQFLQSAVFQYLPDDVVLAAVALQHLFGSDVLSGLGLFGLLHDFQLVEQHFAYLLGGADVECLASHLVDFLLNLLQTDGEVLGRLLQGFRVEQHSVALYIDKYGDERHLYFVEQMFGTLLLQFLFQHVFQFEGDVRILAGITVDIFGWKVAHVLLVFASRSN